MSLNIEKELKEKMEEILKHEHNYQAIEEKFSDHIQKIIEITKRLNIEEHDVNNFVKSLLEKSEHDVKIRNHLKILHFNICNELERLEKIKGRADSSTSTRVTLYLFILLVLLILQTGWFYHMIFNIEHLGWDLVEPATFLFGSIVFLLGVFSYVKLHKNAISGERLFHDLKKGIVLKRYIKTNFNVEKYETLKTQLDIVNRLINESKKI
jgi:hypothetical protein